MQQYQWRVGDVFTNGEYRWRVESVQGDRAILQSCTTAWAHTIPLTYAEWKEGSKWQLETLSEQGLVRLGGQEIREQDVREENTRNIYWRTAEGDLIALPQMTDTHLRNTALMLIGMGYQSFSAPDGVKVLWLRALHCEWARRKAAKH